MTLMSQAQKDGRDIAAFVGLLISTASFLVGLLAPALVELGSDKANLLLGAGITGICGWAMLVNSRLGIFLFMVSSFFSGILNRLSYSLSPVNFQFLIAWPEIGLALIVGIHLLKWVALKKRKLYLIRPLDIAVLLYVAWGALFTLHPKIPLSVGLYGFRLNIVPTLAYFLARVFFRNWSDLRQFYHFLLVISILYLAYGLAQQFGIMPQFERAWINTYSGIAYQRELSRGGAQLGYFIDGHLRAFSIFTVVGEFSYVAVIVGLIIWVGKVYTVTFKYKLLRWLSLVLLFCYFVISLERAAIAMFAGGILLIRTIRGARRRLYARLVLLVIILSIFFLLGSLVLPRISVSNVALRRLVELLNPLEAKTVRGYRLARWQEVVALIARNLLGYGLGTATYNRAAIASGNLLTMPHNYFLLIGVELGILGLLILLFVLFELFKEMLNYLKALPRNSPGRELTYALLGVHAAFWSVGLVSVPVLHTCGVLYWFLMGLVPIIPQLQGGLGPSPEAERNFG
jgi:O-antigen ligase